VRDFGSNSGSYQDQRRPPVSQLFNSVKSGDVNRVTTGFRAGPGGSENSARGFTAIDARVEERSGHRG
jgi:hypothetical protein